MNNFQYSVRETELIQELIKARLEHKAELEHESLEGYELPPRTQFSMLKKPALKVHHNYHEPRAISSCSPPNQGWK